MCISSETLNTLWTMIDDDSLYRSNNKKTKKVNFKSCGRYAASTLNIAGTVVMAGGMVSRSGSHTVTTSIRRLRNSTREIYWEGPAYNRNRDRDNMKTARAFFCLLNMMDTDFLAIGTPHVMHVSWMTIRPLINNRWLLSWQNNSQIIRSSHTLKKLDTKV